MVAVSHDPVVRAKRQALHGYGLYYEGTENGCGLALKESQVLVAGGSLSCGTTMMRRQLGYAMGLSDTGGKRRRDSTIMGANVLPFYASASRYTADLGMPLAHKGQADAAVALDRRVESLAATLEKSGGPSAKVQDKKKTTGPSSPRKRRTLENLPSHIHLRMLAEDDAFHKALARRRSSRLDVERMRRAFNQGSLFRLAEIEQLPANHPLFSSAVVDKRRVLIEYEPYVLESKFVGDALDVFIPQAGIMAHGVVDSIEVDDDVICWSGRFAQLTRGRFSLTQTLLDNYMVGTLEIPQGSFSLEAKNGLGWIVDQADEAYRARGGQASLKPGRAY